MFARLKRGKARFARFFNTHHVWIYWTINSCKFYQISKKFLAKTPRHLTLPSTKFMLHKFHLFNCISVLLFCICWLVPASIVYAITDFSFFDSCYFSMVTFSTVGFGDYTITGYKFKFVIVCFSYFGWDFLS